MQTFRFLWVCNISSYFINVIYSAITQSGTTPIWANAGLLVIKQISAQLELW